MSPRDPLHIRWAYSLTGVTQLPVCGSDHPLEREARRYVVWAAATALVLGLTLFIVWHWWSAREPAPATMRQVTIVRYTELGVPPSISRPSVAQINVAQEVAKIGAPPAIAVPEPVRDEQAGNRTIATQTEMAEALAPITMSDLGAGGGDSIVVQGDLEAEGSPAPEDFVAVDQDPVRLSIAPPAYPEMARQAGVEGSVLVNALVGKNGKVRQVLVISGPEMLRDAAVASAKTAIFRPAILNNKPLEVWVAFPVTFQMRGPR
ncbi:MAG: energy transducer TonB [Candidatus Krumholzibacteriia bacterium]